MIINTIIRRYNEETKFPITPSFVLTHSSDSISVWWVREHETRSNREFCLFVISSYSKLYTLKVYWALFNGISRFITHINTIIKKNIYPMYILLVYERELSKND